MKLKLFVNLKLYIWSLKLNYGAFHYFFLCESEVESLSSRMHNKANFEPKYSIHQVIALSK